MDGSIGVALEDTALLSDICGANDYNLRVMERLFGHRVFCRGNELFLESADPADHSLFRSLLERLMESEAEGLPIGPDLVIAMHTNLTPEGSSCGGAGNARGAGESFFDSCVQIPGGIGKVFPRSRAQSLYLKGLETHDLTLAIGPAGTGKTYLAMAWALKELLTKSRRKLILTRPVVEAGESLGYLPGDLEQKISPYLRPLYDAMEALVPFEIVRRLEESRSIEIAPLAYMRGRSLSNCVVILDEAQNTTKEQMKMFLTRLGENTKAIVTGDITQVDLPRKSDSGLSHALGVLGEVDEILVCRLDARDVVRSELVRKIIAAYENE